MILALVMRGWVGVVASFFLPLIAARCPAGTIQGPTASECYYQTTDALPWQQAEDACVAKGGHLAVITNAKSNDFLSTLLNVRCSNAYWVGASVQRLTMKWTWTDNSTWGTYVNWANAQPTSKATLCLVYNIRNKQWYSEQCASVKPYICKIPAVTTSDGPACPLCQKAMTCPSPAPSEPRRPYCESTWTYFPTTDKGYKILKGYYTWPISQTKCNLLGGHLASIHSAEEETFIEEMTTIGLPVPNAGAGRLGVWIGYKAPNADAQFSWVDGTPTDYTNWGPSRPQAGPMYANMYPDDFTQQPDFSRKWDNFLADTDVSRAAVCKRDY